MLSFSVAACCKLEKLLINIHEEQYTATLRVRIRLVTVFFLSPISIVSIVIVIPSIIAINIDNIAQP